MFFRFAAVSDCAALLNIYKQYIDTGITFECALPSEQAFAERILSIAAFYPYLVCVENGEIIGYAYAHRHMEREAYQWNAELSVYLDRSHTSRGIGKKLYAALIALLKLQGIKTVYGCVTVPNARSEALHSGMGFHTVGTYHRAGYKCGAWHDVRWFEKEIAPYIPAPPDIISIKAVSQDAIQAVLGSC